jgi:hypothetical protein
MEDIENEKEIVRYEKYYSEEGLADKLLKVAKKAGVKVIYAALLLYYTLLDDAFPPKERLIIIGALGYSKAQVRRVFGEVDEKEFNLF